MGLRVAKSLVKSPSCITPILIVQQHEITDGSVQCYIIHLLFDFFT